MELLKVDTIEEAFRKLYAYAAGKSCMDAELYEGNTTADMNGGGEADTASGLRMKTERIALTEAAGRVTAEDIVSNEDIPPMPRSVMDGYALRSADTGGASESVPSFLRMTYEVEMGKAPNRTIGSGECAYIPTGGFLPQGCDAVVMSEHCEAFGKDSIAVYETLSPGRNLVQTGDDMRKGETILRRGKRLNYADIGVLAAAGHTEIPVYKPWRIHIISTGDEIVPPESKPQPGQMRDVNSYTLSALAAKYGFEAESELIGDDEAVLEKHIRKAMQSCDIVAVSGGSSQGKKDCTAKIIARLASSGVLTHGIAVKPGKPTILGYDVPSRCVLMGLPGHPVAAALLFDLFAGGLWRALSGEAQAEKPRFLYGRLDVNLAASPGRMTFQPVKIREVDNGEDDTEVQAAADRIRVHPVLGKSGLIRTLSEADGYIVMERNREGLKKGSIVKLYLL